jgi:hypothetical protein
MHLSQLGQTILTQLHNAHLQTQKRKNSHQRRRQDKKQRQGYGQLKPSATNSEPSMRAED